MLSLMSTGQGPDRSVPGPFGDRGADGARHASGTPRPRLVRPSGLWRRPVEPDVVSDRLNILVHELAGLVDGSLRHVAVLMKDAPAGEPVEPDAAHARLRTVNHALERMAEAIRHAGGAAPSPWLQANYDASLADAVQYAVGIMEPVAAERGVRIECALDERFRLLPPGHVYTVVVNALRNAIEAIVAGGGRRVVPRGAGKGGAIEVRGAIEMRGEREWVRLEIIDTGVGPPPLDEGREDEVFEPSFSTKPGGLGIGLSLSRQIVESLGGTIQLAAAQPETVSKHARGAVLVVRFPADAANESQQLIG